MRLLIDTHILLWWLADDIRLSKHHHSLISNPLNKIYISSASTWEIYIKQALGKIKIPSDLEQEILKNNFTPLPITIKHTSLISNLPLIHKDPFDRIIISQAISDELTILTEDSEIKKYSVICL